MLIEFSVANFASFRERQTLSMVAAPQLRRRENTFEPDVEGEKLPRLLKVVAIYGPNASGKSNLLNALKCTQQIAMRDPSSGGALPVRPFRFDPALVDKESEFEIHFIHGRQRYSFELHATPDRIVLERLISYPRGKEQLLYERIHTELGERYRFGEALEGENVLHDIWRKATPPRTLFIAQAVANSSEELTQLRPPLHWLRVSGIFVSGNLKSTAAHSQYVLKHMPTYVDSLQKLLKEIDVPITKIVSTSKETSDKDREKDEDDPGNYKTTLTHTTLLGEANFDLSEESEGTQNLIGFWLPWYISRATTRDSGPLGKLLVVDELDASLHPSIINALVVKHLNAETPSQLIFTSHNTHLMDKRVMRRDQFWLTERDANGATQLRSVHDFKGRDSEDIEKRYFEGKYRSLPYIS